jgi:hypothetical protein
MSIRIVLLLLLAHVLPQLVNQFVVAHACTFFFIGSAKKETHILYTLKKPMFLNNDGSFFSLDNDSTIMNYLKVLLIFVLFITDCYGVKDKFVSITLDAKWLDTPLHQEARYIYISI